MTKRLARGEQGRQGWSLRLAAALLWFVGLVVVNPAVAQAPVCRQIEAELSSLSSGGGGARNAQYARAATRARAQAARIGGQMGALGCRDGGFVLFGGGQPAQCPVLRSQYQALLGEAAQYERAARSGGNEGRRQQLLAALDRYGCRGREIDVPPPPRNLLEAIFGRRGPAIEYDPYRPRGREGEPLEQQDGLIDPDERTETRARGGGLPVCVRTCDGYFFPVNFEGARQSNAHEDLCTALCPAAETRLFWMRPGGEIKDAADRNGEAYSALPNALKYQSSRDTSCSCKRPGETWAQALAGSEEIVTLKKGDVIVTPEQSQESARPQQPPPLRGATTPKKAKNQTATVAAAAVAPPVTDPDTPAPVDESSIPTAGSASAGIGPRLREDRVLGSGQGETRDVIGADGSRRTVRVIAPPTRDGRAAATRP